ncbi:MAG: methyltransferase [Nanoarchaeota archaeon]|nr:methyltransferase [Nanoarchaeota archaeon]
MKHNHYYSEKQDSQLNLTKIRINVSDLSFEIYSGSGIFSKDSLDNGSRLLIENCLIIKDWHVLDLGCGNGVIGVSVKKLHPTAKILMTDINERAVELTMKNIALHALDETDARKGNSFDDIPETFDTILLNPPQTAGKDVCFEMIEKSKEHLNINGLLQLVARHNKGGKTLSLKMEDVFGNVNETAKKGGFRVYVSRKE